VEVDDNGDEQDGQGMLISKGKMSVDMMVEDEGESYQDGSATQRLRRRTRSPTLRNDEDGDGQGDLKRQRWSRIGLQEMQGTSNQGSSSKNS
jgi:hypothetical protein